MTLIQQLSQHVTPDVKKQVTDATSSDMALESLLEQFYAIFATRLSDTALIPKLASLTPTAQQTNLFERIWSNQTQRETIIHELAESHHLTQQTVQQVIQSASDNAYQHISQLAEGNSQSIAEYVATNLDAMRAYLPTWAGEVIPVQLLSSQTSQTSKLPAESYSQQNTHKQINNQAINQQSINNHSINNHSINSNRQNTNQQNSQSTAPVNSASLKQSQPKTASQSLHTQPRGRKNASKNVPKPKKSFGLAMLLVPLLGLGLAGGGIWLMNEKANSNPSLNSPATASSETATTETQASEGLAKDTPSTTPAETAENTNDNSAQNQQAKQNPSVTFNADDLNNQANGKGLPSGKTDGTAPAGQEVTGVSNSGANEQIVYDFSPKNQGVDPNSLEALASTTIGSDSVPAQSPPKRAAQSPAQPVTPAEQQSNPSNTNSSNEPNNPNELNDNQPKLEHDVIGVEPNPSGEDIPVATPSDPETSSKSAPRKTYNPITGKTIIVGVPDL